MKFFYSIVLSASFFLAFTQVKDLSADQWREDLRFLQKKITTEYPHLFYRITQEEFDEKVEELFAEIPDLKDHEIIVRMASIVASFKIGHTGISLTESYHGSVLRTGFHQFPLNFYLFKDGLFVQGVHEKYAHLVGAEVLRIGKYETKEALIKIRPVVSIENEQFFKAYGINLLRCPEILNAMGISAEVSRVSMTFKKHGEIIEESFDITDAAHVPSTYGFVVNEADWINFRNADETPYWLMNLNEKYRFDYLEDARAIYVRQSEIKDDSKESISQFYRKVFQFVEQNEVEKFILDVRLNGGGSGHLNLPVVLGLIKSRLNQKGKLFVIIGRNTFSAAQNLVNQLETYTDAIFVGEPTSSNVNSWGDPKVETLPNSQLDVRLSFLWHQEKHPLDLRIWTKPDVSIEMSSMDYAMNRDVALNAILNFEESLYHATIDIERLYEEKDYERASARGKGLGARFPHDEAKIRSHLNTIGYSLMRKDMMKAALEVLILNTQLYPHSPNTWDSLAECYLKLNDVQNAIKYYKKVIEMDAEGRAGDNARVMLKTIERHMGN
ncbi:MAG: hypothetical protein ABJG47_10380 [Ekhidna sp.]